MAFWDSCKNCWPSLEIADFCWLFGWPINISTFCWHLLTFATGRNPDQGSNENNTWVKYPDRLAGLPPSILDTPPKSILWMFQIILSLEKNLFFCTKNSFFKKIQKSKIFIMGVRALQKKTLHTLQPSPSSTRAPSKPIMGKADVKSRKKKDGS